MMAIHKDADVRLTTKSKERISPTICGTTCSGATSVWSRMVNTFVLAVLASTLIACGAGLASQGGPRITQDRSKITGKALLIGDQAEAAGYGLYSYVLFESPPTSETKPIYLAVILACLKEIPDLGGLEKKYRPESLNAMYIPITGASTDAQISPSDQPEAVRMKAKAEEILQRYNYGRAQAILKRISTVQKNGGPYLLSSLAPVSSSTRIGLALYQDLSAVHFVSDQDDQKQMAYEWVLDFVDRVSNPQSTAWDRTTLGNFSDEVREARQPAFKRYNVRADQLDLKKYIVFPIPDTNAERTLPFPTWKTSVGYGGPTLVTVLE